MRLVTYATHSARYFPVLVQSCQRLGYSLDVLGWGQPWPGWMGRLQATLMYVEALDPNEIVVVIDAYDVIMLRPPSELEQAFLAMRAPLVISVEETPSLLPKLWFGTCRGSSLNAGTYAGRASAVSAMLRALAGAASSLRTDDQALLTDVCNRNLLPAGTALDVACRLFLVVTFLTHTPEQVVDGLRTGRYNNPCVLHGPAAFDMAAIFTALDYAVPPGSSELIRKERRDAQLERVRTAIAAFLVLLIVATCVLAGTYAVVQERRRAKR